ncbi:hypothetical protein I312_100856 [Cryptococcus bacillisporus CA1280]|uniref:uncharacterized protein n=1 Tax=Cryptococcus bacillisporus CA1280 TaxID=1296109 RepID=UPI0033697F21
MSTERVEGQFGCWGIHASRLTHSSSSISQTFPPVPRYASSGRSGREDEEACHRLEEAYGDENLRHFSKC